MKKINSILLIDDDDAANFFNKIIISKSVFDVQEISIAKNGQLALDYLNDCNKQKLALPEIIFLDINMPIMNGWEFLEVLLTLDFCKNIQLIAMLTSSYNDQDQKKAEQYEPIKKFIKKPLTTKKVNKILQKYVDGVLD